MKKLFALLLTLVILFSLIACQKGNSPQMPADSPILDEGIITQEEFDTTKKQLLNL